MCHLLYLLPNDKRTIFLQHVNVEAVNKSNDIKAVKMQTVKRSNKIFFFVAHKWE